MTSNSLCKCSPRRVPFPHRRAVEHRGGARGDLRTVGGPLGLHANAHLGAPTSPQVELAAIFELSAALSARLTALMPEARLRPVLIALDGQ
jgi:hypothetical protein